MSNNEAIQRLMILREQVGPLSRMALDKAIDALEKLELPLIDRPCTACEYHAENGCSKWDCEFEKMGAIKRK